MTDDEIGCIEEGGTEPAIALLCRLAAALDADVRLTAGHDLGSPGSKPAQPDRLRPHRAPQSLDARTADMHDSGSRGVNPPIHAERVVLWLT